MTKIEINDLLKKVRKIDSKAYLSCSALGTTITIKKEFANSVRVLCEIVADNPKEFFIHARSINSYFRADEKEAFKYMIEMNTTLSKMEW